MIQKKKASVFCTKTTVEAFPEEKKKARHLKNWTIISLWQTYCRMARSSTAKLRERAWIWTLIWRSRSERNHQIIATPGDLNETGIGSDYDDGGFEANQMLNPMLKNSTSSSMRALARR